MTVVAEGVERSRDELAAIRLALVAVECSLYRERHPVVATIRAALMVAGRLIHCCRSTMAFQPERYPALRVVILPGEVVDNFEGTEAEELCLEGAYPDYLEEVVAVPRT